MADVASGSESSLEAAPDVLPPIDLSPLPLGDPGHVLQASDCNPCPQSWCGSSRRRSRPLNPVSPIEVTTAGGDAIRGGTAHTHAFSVG